VIREIDIFRSVAKVKEALFSWVSGVLLVPITKESKPKRLIQPAVEDENVNVPDTEHRAAS